ncbi:hypothetical protein B0H19DRAFT_1066534 [Mycena capillaripes]|nr:hypothetical protein B0H19DRAFT_1066534 [Mycena capillaripes]
MWYDAVATTLGTEYWEELWRIRGYAAVWVGISLFQEPGHYRSGRLTLVIFECFKVIGHVAESIGPRDGDRSRDSGGVGHPANRQRRARGTFKQGGDGRGTGISDRVERVSEDPSTEGIPGIEVVILPGKPQRRKMKRFGAQAKLHHRNLRREHGYQCLTPVYTGEGAFGCSKTENSADVCIVDDEQAGFDSRERILTDWR